MYQIQTSWTNVDHLRHQRMPLKSSYPVLKDKVMQVSTKTQTLLRGQMITVNPWYILKPVLKIHKLLHTPKTLK
jgi:alkyl hydroperoxide reductase subunit AhpC